MPLDPNRKCPEKPKPSSTSSADADEKYKFFTLDRKVEEIPCFMKSAAEDMK